MTDFEEETKKEIEKLKFEKQKFGLWEDQFDEKVEYNVWVIRPGGLSQTKVKLSPKTLGFVANPAIKKIIFGNDSGYTGTFFSQKMKDGGCFAILFDEDGYHKCLPDNPTASKLLGPMGFSRSRGNFLMVSLRVDEDGDEHPRDMPDLFEDDVDKD